MTNRVKNIWHIIGITWAAAVFELFFLLCLFELKGVMPAALFLTVVIIGSTVNAALLAVELLGYFFKKEFIYKFCILAYSLLIFAAVLGYILIKTGFMEIVGSEESLRDYLKRAGVWMSVLFIFIQFLQVVILPIPSTVTVVAGSALFGPFLGSVYSLIGILIGSVTAFLIGRYAGYHVVAWLIGKETLEKWLKKVKGKDKFLLSAMFLLPVFPDDVLCFVAGFSSMSLWFFVCVIFLSRVLAIFMTSYSVSLIPLNTWWGLLTWGIIIALFIVLFVFLYKKADAIEKWISKKLHRETRVEQSTQKDEFTLEIVDPNGSIVKKGIKKRDCEPPIDQARK